MKAKSLLLFLVFISFFSTQALAEEQSEMTVQLRKDGSAHIFIASRGLSNLEDLRRVVQDPAIASIYRDQLASIFSEAGNLSLSLRSDAMVIEFDTPLAMERDGSWEVEGREFRGAMKRMSSLRIRPPEGTELILSEPAAEEVSGEWVWKEADAIPHIVYRQESQWPLVLVSILLLMLGALAVRRRLRG